MPQDFSGQNLRGRSFQGQDLRGANFSYANIQGANFTSANLKGANFSHAKAGLQSCWAIFWIAVSFLLAVLSGLSSASTNGASWWNLSPKEAFQQNALIFGVVMLGLFLIFCLITVRNGLTAGLGAWIVALALTATLAAVGSATAYADEAFYEWSSAIAIALAVTGGVAGTVSGTLAVAETVTQGTGTVIVVGALTGGVVGALVRVLIRDGGNMLSWQPIWSWNWAWVDLVWAWTWAWALALIGAYIGWQILRTDSQLTLIQTIAVAIATIGGTSFQGANLSDSDFTQATLKSTDFRHAILFHTCWYQAKKLNLARVGGTYLESPQVRQLVVSRTGQNRNYEYENLQGVNLQGTNLVDASFIGANLNEANLQDANLSRAKLKQTQLDGADFTGACLTGAYIEDWGITAETKLDRVECQYVYMRLPTRDNPDPCRKPDNYQENFEPSDFAEFIEPIVDTLDLYHNHGVDPRAIAISFKQMAEKNPEAGLEIVAMEKRGRNKFLLRAKVAEGVNRSQLSAEYFSTYNQLKSLPENHMRLLLAEKDNRIQQLENMVVTALNRPSFYTETYYHQGDTMSDKSSDIKIGDVTGGIGAFAGGDVRGVVGQNMTGVAGGDISGTVTNSISQLQESEAPEAPKLADLLKQLQIAIEADTELTTKSKEKALKQVKTLAQAAQNPEEEEKQDLADTAITMLKGIIAGLPTTAALVEASKTLLPAIASVLGLA